MVEPQPSKLIMPVRSRSAALSETPAQWPRFRTVRPPESGQNRLRATNVQQRATFTILCTQPLRRSTRNQLAPVGSRRGNLARRPALEVRPFPSFRYVISGASRVAAELRFASCPRSARGRPLTHLDCPELSSKRRYPPGSTLELPRDNLAWRPVPDPTVSKDSPTFGRTSCPSQPLHEIRNRRRTDGFSNRGPVSGGDVGNRYRDRFRTPLPRCTPTPGWTPAGRQNEAWRRNQFRPTNSGTLASRQMLRPIRTGPSDPRRMRYSCLVECVKDLGRRKSPAAIGGKSVSFGLHH